MLSCAIFGCGGHGRVVAEIAELNGYQNIAFFDDQWPRVTSNKHWNVVGDMSTLQRVAKQYDLVIVAVGNNVLRYNIQRELRDLGAIFKVTVHPTATISQYSVIKPGSVVMANAVVNPFCNIGESCIINSGSIVEHDCNIGHAVHISPGSNLAGGVSVGDYSWIGIGSQIKQLVRIGTEVVVGAGSTVVKDVPNFFTVLGSPARRFIKN